MKKSVDGKKEYVTPVCELARVELEDGVCTTVTSNDPAKVKSAKHIEVEEYNFVDNKITFD